YEPFRKQFYEQHPDVKKMTPFQVKELRDELQGAGFAALASSSSGAEAVPAPIRSFTYAGFDDTLLSEVVRQGFEAPTPIQAQSLPIIMS
ncbi:unnamed protein product, partial [Discosporangium mesarthrocarpum]